MLPTLVIGLREVLEAALIVGIIAAFLRKNGRPLGPMWIGVGAAVVIAVGVGVALHLIMDGLPQRGQEAMETVIGAVAVVFVTAMVLFMSTHARDLRREVEASAESALGDGTVKALVVMAFLAVLKEGFETAVFLLATFQTATNTTVAVLGAVIGTLISIGIGFGIYTGGVSINLGKFFKVTSVFLILVAAGLVVTALRTAHGAGWINGGQTKTVDLSAIAPPGSSVQGALVTGVLGIPAQPVLIQVIGWFAYVVPMSLLLFWPAKYRLDTKAGLWVRGAVAVLLVAVAGVLALTVAPAEFAAPGPAPIVTGEGAATIGTARLDGQSVVLTIGSAASTWALTGGTTGDHDGVGRTVHYSLPASAIAGLPDRVSLAELFKLNGNRLPVGVDGSIDPGPFDATWTASGAIEVWTTDGILFDATGSGTMVLKISGGGLSGPRTLTVKSGAALPGGRSAPGGSWQVAGDYVATVRSGALALGNARTERQFRGREIPLLLVLGAAAVAARALHLRRRRSTGRPGRAADPAEPALDVTT